MVELPPFHRSFLGNFVVTVNEVTKKVKGHKYE